MLSFRRWIAASARASLYIGAPTRARPWDVSLSAYAIVKPGGRSPVGALSRIMQLSARRATLIASRESGASRNSDLSVSSPRRRTPDAFLTCILSFPTPFLSRPMRERRTNERARALARRRRRRLRAFSVAMIYSRRSRENRSADRAIIATHFLRDVTQIHWRRTNEVLLLGGTMEFGKDDATPFATFNKKLLQSVFITVIDRAM